MLRRWIEALPLFAVRAIAKRRCQVMPMGSAMVVQAAPDTVFIVGNRTSMPVEEQNARLRNLLSRWQGAMRFSGVAALAEDQDDANPVARLIRDTDDALRPSQRQRPAHE